MRNMKRFIALLLAIMTLNMLPVLAEETAEAELVQRSPVLDAAFKMVEDGNPFLAAYNEITGAGIENYFPYVMPYFFGGKPDQQVDGVPLWYSQYPEYAKRKAWENTHFYRKGAYYIYGMDCSGYTLWICDQVGWPEHDALDQMILNYGKYGKYHLYSHRKGQTMPPYTELAQHLEIGDFLAAKKGSRHIMMFIGTLRDFGFTAETAPELAAYLDYALVIHSGPNPDYGARIQQYLDEHAGEAYYADVKIPTGGVAVSILGVPMADAPHHAEVQGTEYAWFELPGGYKITIWDLPAATSFVWYRNHGK